MPHNYGANGVPHNSHNLINNPMRTRQGSEETCIGIGEALVVIQIRGGGLARSQQEYQVLGAQEGWQVARVRHEDARRRPQRISAWLTLFASPTQLLLNLCPQL